MEYTGKPSVLKDTPPQTASEELREGYKGESWTGEGSDVEQE